MQSVRFLTWLASGVVIVAGCLGASGTQGLSEGAVREFSARTICPEAPERILPDLLPYYDSVVWRVYVRASDQIVDLRQISSPSQIKAEFILQEPEAGRLVLVGDGKSSAYLHAAQEACSRGDTLP
jgi:hypothetical protein